MYSIFKRKNLILTQQKYMYMNRHTLTKQKYILIMRKYKLHCTNLNLKIKWYRLINNN